MQTESVNGANEWNGMDKLEAIESTCKLKVKRKKANDDDDDDTPYHFTYTLYIVDSDYYFSQRHMRSVTDSLYSLPVHQNQKQEFYSFFVSCSI